MNELDEFLARLVEADKGKQAETDEEAGSTPPEFAGLYYPLSYVLDTWLFFREHGVMPEQGGVNDQDPRLIFHDWRVVQNRYAYISKHGPPSVSLPENARDWMSLF